MAVSISQPSLVSDAPHFTPQELPALRALARRFPTVDAAVNEIAHLRPCYISPRAPCISSAMCMASTKSSSIF